LDFSSPRQRAWRRRSRACTMQQEFENLWKQRAAVQNDLKILGGP
jgi:hypothetical protein